MTPAIGQEALSSHSYTNAAGLNPPTSLDD